ncbi:MAG: trypsin-like peptidase domain-containing protein [Bdellovibrionales bacterium]
MKPVLLLFLFFLTPFSFGVDLSKSFIKLAQKVQPSVVNISTLKRKGKNFIQLAPGFYIPHQTPKQMGSGSGFIISKDGLIVTNAHVVKGSDTIQVQLAHDKKLYTAKILGKDQLSDIALLKINIKKRLTPVIFGDSEKLQVGEWVAAIGNPHGYGHTMTKGIISAVKREIDELNLFPLLQTDASINPGNSGGPLMNLKGEVIGVNNAIAAGANGISFAIPINNVKTVLKDLQNYGYVRRGFIGVQFQPSLNGAFIKDIVKGGPADRAGLKVGDIIIEFNNKPIKKSRDLPKIVDKTPVGKKTKVIVLRNKKKKTFSIAPKILAPNGITLSKNPKKNPKGINIAKIGFGVAKPTPQLLKRFGLPRLSASHPIVTHVENRSLADWSGLQIGDYIAQVNGQPSTSVQKLQTTLNNKGEHLIQVLRYHKAYDQYLAFMIKLKV